MRRRQFITTVALASIAGCSQSESPTNRDDTAADTETPTGSSTKTSVGPARRHVGDEYRRSDATMIRLDTLRLARTVKFNSGAVAQSSDGTALLLAKVNATNPSDSITRFPEVNAFTVIADDSQYKPLAVESKTGSDALIEFPWSGSVYSAVSNAHPGVSTTGWILFEVPDTTTTVRMMLARKATNNPAVYWDGAVDPETLPQMEVQSVNAPAEHVNGESIHVSVSVRNTGGTTGVFNRSFVVIPERTSKHQSDRLVAKVPSGKTKTINRTVPARSAQNLTIAVPPDTRRTITVIPAERSFGGPYTLSNGVRVKVDRPIITDTVTIDEGGSTFRDGTHDSNEFATFEITAWNPTDSPQTEPDDDWFEVEVDGFVDSEANRGFYRGLKEPVERPYYRGWKKSNIPPGGSTSGVLYYDVPKNTEVGDVLCRGLFPAPGSASETCIWRSE